MSDVSAVSPGLPAAPTLPAAPSSIPWMGLLAVLMGTFISTLNGRLSTFGLSDMRGAVHAGFDEGAWITTAQTVAQMLIAPAAVWMGMAFGARTVLMAASLAFCADIPRRTSFKRTADAAVPAIRRGPGIGILHSPDAELRASEHAAEVLGLRHRHLCAEPRTVAQYFRVARRVVCGAPFLALDFLAERAAGPDHDAVSALRDPSQTRQSAASARRPVRLDRGGSWIGTDLCRPGSGQSAGLAQLGIGLRPAGVGARCC